ncbi:glycosyltransferase [Hymenobacter guriensis]|uniref:Glycosyltransferase n=1 Tax=Hymenobacter guriensis TaxID=2793065 RepID=A0ABS0L3G0_9BACT|nr:glycosyltransferase [Hymenobacter guriensis]MBG8554628.1 glycosyltransferase [Hymenobacter guriensis]
MQPPRTILLASVLKPLDDTRMYEKFGRTLARLPQVQVHAAGRQAPPPMGPANLHTHNLLAGTRLSWARLRAQARYWHLLRRLRPELVVVHAPELLPLTLLWHWLGRGRRFVYDVQENFALNIRTQHVYPAVVRGLLAAAVRGLETLAAAAAEKVILAEKSYADELPFATPARTLVLENKYQPPGPELPRPTPVHLSPNQPLELLYSGTISELNGVLAAVEFARALRQVWPGSRLTIIGFCQHPALLPRLQVLAAESGGAVELVGGAEPVPHMRIIEAIRRSHLGLLPYQEHPSFWRCVPTKLFEYMAHALPVLVPRNPLWQQFIAPHQAGLAVDFADTSSAAVAQMKRDLVRHGFYLQGVPAEVFWHSEEQKLLALLDFIR